MYLTLKVGQMHWLKTSVTHYPLTLHSIPEDWRPVNKLTWLNLENVNCTWGSSISSHKALVFCLLVEFITEMIHCATDFVSNNLGILFCCVGMGPMPWTINSEIYPMWARSSCNSVATSVNWMFNLLISMTFLTLTKELTKEGKMPAITITISWYVALPCSFWWHQTFIFYFI